MEETWGSSESAKERHTRILNDRVKKAQNLNDRINLFVRDIETSTILNNSEKRFILSNLKFTKIS
jgi:hypothetical protein